MIESGTTTGQSGLELRFLGATGTVTGSRYLLKHLGRRVLVDCGLYQGLKQLRLRNWSPFPVPASSIDAVILTHAHLDHSGYLPRLVAEGFEGSVHVTPGTNDLLPILLKDSGRLQEEDARYANRHGFSRHAPALPLYTEAQALEALRLTRVQAFGASFEPIPGLQVTFSHAGHIVGAASLHVASELGSITFSGDLGRLDDVMMKAPAAATDADVVVIESTYGDRVHAAATAAADQLCAAIARAAARGGSTLIPAFAVGRAQAVLHTVLTLRAARRIPDLPVYLNSPMATDVSRLMLPHADEHHLSAQALGDLATQVRYVKTEEESRALNQPKFPCVIVAASGMATGGRVLHHLKAMAPHPEHVIAFVGHQAAGTRGSSLVGGAGRVRLHGEWVPVRAEVCEIDGMSAHADRDQLLGWLSSLRRAPRHVYVTHGEPEAADSLRQAIEERFGWPASVPDYLQTVSF